MRHSDFSSDLDGRRRPKLATRKLNAGGRIAESRNAEYVSSYNTFIHTLVQTSSFPKNLTNLGSRALIRHLTHLTLTIYSDQLSSTVDTISAVDYSSTCLLY